MKKNNIVFYHGHKKERMMIPATCQAEGVVRPNFCYGNFIARVASLVAKHGNFHVSGHFCKKKLLFSLEIAIPAFLKLPSKNVRAMCLGPNVRMLSFGKGKGPMGR